MTATPDQLKNTAIHCLLTWNDARTCVEIQPVFSAESSDQQILIASLEIDRHELIPSCRIPLQAGANQCSLPSMRIASPAGCGALDAEKVYIVTLKIHCQEGVTLILEKSLSLSF